MKYFLFFFVLLSIACFVFIDNKQNKEKDITFIYWLFLIGLLGPIGLGIYVLCTKKKRESMD